MRSRSIRRLVVGSSVLALMVSTPGIAAATAPEVGNAAAATFSEKALNALPKNARNVFDLIPVADPTGDVGAPWLDIEVAGYGVGTLNKQAAKFLNQRPRKAGRWWDATAEPFRKGDRVLAFAARTAAAWPGDTSGGLVWTLGQDGPDAFGYYAGGVNDPFAGNAVIDNFGVFEGQGSFFPGGGRTSLGGLTLGGSPDYYDTPGGTGFRKGRTTVAFLPVLNVVTKSRPSEWRGLGTFNASLRGQVDGVDAFDHLAPGAGQHRYSLDGDSLPAGLRCFSVGIYPQYGPGATTPAGYDIELSLGGTAAFLDELVRGSSDSWLGQVDRTWTHYPDLGSAFAIGTVRDSTLFIEDAFLEAVGLAAPPILDPQRAGFAAGDPTCGRRTSWGHVCEAGLAGVIARVFEMEQVPTEMPFRFNDLSDACLYFGAGMDQPFAVASTGSRPIDGAGFGAQIGAHEGCETLPVELGEEGFAILCGEADEQALSYVWRAFGSEGGGPGPYTDRFALEFLPQNGLPPQFLPATLDSTAAGFDPSLHVDPFVAIGQAFTDTVELPPLEPTDSVPTD